MPLPLVQCRLWPWGTVGALTWPTTLPGFSGTPLCPLNQASFPAFRPWPCSFPWPVVPWPLLLLENSYSYLRGRRAITPFHAEG